MDIQVVQNRLELMRIKKANLLKMKRAERGDKLSQTVKTISILKRWIKELS